MRHRRFLCTVGSVTFVTYPKVAGGGFEPPKADADRFTVCSLWPLGNPSRDDLVHCFLSGAPYPNRTDHLLITSQLLYQYELTGPNAFFLWQKETELVYLKKIT